MKTYCEAQDECNEKNRILSLQILLFGAILKGYNIRADGKCIYSIERRRYKLIEFLREVFLGEKPKRFFVKFNCKSDIDGLRFTVSKRINDKKIGYSKIISAPQIDSQPKVIAWEADFILKELKQAEKNQALKDFKELIYQCGGPLESKDI